MNDPTVTIAIPTRNRVELLRQALASIAAQTYRDFEVVVCDNASDDATPEVVRSFGPQFRLDRSDRNIGFAGNHLRALDAGTAPYLSVLQDDDLLARNSLERRMRMIEADPSITMVHSAFDVADFDLRPIESAANWDGSARDIVRDPSTFRGRTFGDGRRSHVSVSLYRRDAIERSTMNERDAEAIELAVSLRCSVHGPIGFLAEPLGTIRYHAEQNAVRTGVADAERMFERTFTQIALFREATERFLELFGRSLPEAGHLRTAATRWTCFELRRQILLRLPPGPAPRTAAEFVRAAARIEPAVRHDPRMLWVFANALIPAGGRDRVASLRRSHRSRARADKEHDFPPQSQPTPERT